MKLRENQEDQTLWIIRVFYLPTDAQYSCFKRILKFTLKQLLHVSVQSPTSGSVLFELSKVIVTKIISLKYSVVVGSVVWLHLVLCLYWCVWCVCVVCGVCVVCVLCVCVVCVWCICVVCV
jgi:hypothetical protein